MKKLITTLTLLLSSCLCLYACETPQDSDFQAQDEVPFSTEASTETEEETEEENKAIVGSCIDEIYIFLKKYFRHANIYHIPDKELNV